MTSLHWGGWAVLALGAALMTGLIAIGLQHLLRGTPLRRIRALDPARAPTARDATFPRLVATFTGAGLSEGNRVDVLFNGAGIYPRLLEELAGARDLITWHVFWHRPGRLADQVKDVLIASARAGVQVLFLRDWYGSRGVPSAYYHALADAGIEVATFRPLRWRGLYKLQQRSHTRAVVIDGRVGYTGGFAIADEWLGDGRVPGEWRDSSVRIEGPCVRQLQAGFVDNWTEATGELLIGERVFPDEVRPAGGCHAGVLFATPSLGSTEAERYFALSITGARERLYITNAYFIPNDDFRRLLVEAAARGVDVRVLTPGANTDRPATWYAGRHRYEELLAAGIRIWEYRPTMVHAKSLVADGIWASVGTLNFDNRSMALNDEVTLLCHGAELGSRLEERFLFDLELADELELDQFRERGSWERAKERFAAGAARVL